MLKLLVLTAILSTVDCVVYNGSCPPQEFKVHQNFTCSKVIGSNEKFKVLAHLPTPNSAFNIFHNPMGAIDDLEVQLMCSELANDMRKEPEIVKFFLSCNATTKEGVKFGAGCNFKSLNTTSHSWDVIKYDDCEFPDLWNSINIVNYVNHSIAVLWGCRNLPNNTHEQGAWVLGYKSNFSEAEKLLDRILRVDLAFTKALTKDYILYNETYVGNSSLCSFKTCSSNILCKSEADDSEELD